MDPDDPLVLFYYADFLLEEVALAKAANSLVSQEAATAELRSLFRRSLEFAPGFAASRAGLARSYLVVADDPATGAELMSEVFANRPWDELLSLQFAYLLAQSGQREQVREIFARHQGEPPERSSSEERERLRELLEAELAETGG